MAVAPARSSSQVRNGRQPAWTIFCAERSLVVTGINATIDTAGTDGGGVSLTVRKCANGQAITAGIALHPASLNLKTAANSEVALTLSSTLDDLILALGDRIGLQRSTHRGRRLDYYRPGASIGPEADLLTTRGAQPGAPSGGPPPGGAALGALATRRWSSVRTIPAATADAK
jgi:hypothetical protein